VLSEVKIDSEDGTAMYSPNFVIDVQGQCFSRSAIEVEEESKSKVIFLSAMDVELLLKLLHIADAAESELKDENS